MGQMVAVCDVVKLDKPISGMFFGKGTIERFRDVCKENDVELLVVDATLSPVQQRNLFPDLRLLRPNLKKWVLIQADVWKYMMK